MRNLLFLLCFVLLTLGVKAQPSKDNGKWFVGLTGGAIISDMKNASIFYHMTDKQSFTAGGVLGYQISKDLSLQVEMVYEQRIFRSQKNSTGLRLHDTSRYVCRTCFYNYDVAFTSDYLTLPLIVSYMKSKKRLSFNMQAGLYYSMLLMNNNQGFEEFYLDPVGAARFIPYGFEPGRFRKIYSGAATNLINTYDAGLLLGVAGKFSLQKHIDVLLEGRMQIGFVGIFENPQMVELNYKGYLLRAGLLYKLKRAY